MSDVDPITVLRGLLSGEPMEDDPAWDAACAEWIHEHGAQVEALVEAAWTAGAMSARGGDNTGQRERVRAWVETAANTKNDPRPTVAANISRTSDARLIALAPALARGYADALDALAPYTENHNSIRSFGRGRRDECPCALCQKARAVLADADRLLGDNT